MLVTDQIRDLILQLEEIDPSAYATAECSSMLRELVSELTHACALPEVQERYQRYRESSVELSHYPLDAEGYAVSFDPIEQEQEFFESWQKYGIVVGKAIASPDLCSRSIERLCSITEALSDGTCSLSDPSTYQHVPVDPNGTPLISRGFFEIYHDKVAADLRQLLRLYIHHTIIWGTANLWTSFDRFGIKLPEHEDSKGLPLHVDQNPLQHPDFRTIQGVLALVDCPKERGSFVGVPGSRDRFHDYGRMAGSGEYVELDMSDPLAASFEAYTQVLPLRAGDLVSWDSRTTHCNSANLSDQLRIVAYIAAGPVPLNEQEAYAPRAEAFQSGLGSNVRDSLMHASMPPRYTHPNEIARVRTPEQLTLLGKLLYGQESYARIK